MDGYDDDLIELQQKSVAPGLIKEATPASTTNTKSSLARPSCSAAGGYT